MPNEVIGGSKTSRTDMNMYCFTMPRYTSCDTYCDHSVMLSEIMNPVSPPTPSCQRDPNTALMHMAMSRSNAVYSDSKPIYFLTESRMLFGFADIRLSPHQSLVSPDRLLII